MNDAIYDFILDVGLTDDTRWQRRKWGAW